MAQPNQRLGTGYLARPDRDLGLVPDLQPIVVHRRLERHAAPLGEPLADRLQPLLELADPERLLQRLHHVEAARLADAQHFLERCGVVTADQQQVAVEAAGRKNADDLDGVGVAEREIEDDDVRHHCRERGLDAVAGRELVWRESDRRQDIGNELANLRLIVNDERARK